MNWLKLLVFVPIVAMANFSGDVPKGYPTEESVKTAVKNQLYQRAVTVYRFFYPTISMEASFEGNRMQGVEDNGGLIYMAGQPHHLIFTANSDTPYAAAVVDLTAGPFVVEMPAGPYMGLVNDHNYSWIIDLGIPGPDKGKGGKYLILPPGFTGETPKGYYVAKAKTNKVILALRYIPKKGEESPEARLSGIKTYFLSRPAQVLSYTNVTGATNFDSTPLRWEDNINYWEKLSKVVSEEPVLEEYKYMYGLLRDLGIVKGKPFAPSEQMKALLVKAAQDGLSQMRAVSFANRRTDRFTWADRKWEWAAMVPNVDDFRTESGIDLEARDKWFYQAIGTSPAMFRRTTDAGSLYWLGVRDTTGAYLDGGKNYRLSIPTPIPANLFWSITVYDANTRSQIQTSQNRAAIRSLYENVIADGEGGIVLYFGPKAPAGKEANWIQTNPGDGWFAYFRIYGPQPAAFDGSWKLGDFEVVK